MPLEVRPHWRIIGSYCLTYEGTHGHAMAVLRAAANASENARLMKLGIRKEAQKDSLCLDDCLVISNTYNVDLCAPHPLSIVACMTHSHTVRSNAQLRSTAILCCYRESCST